MYKVKVFYVKKYRKTNHFPYWLKKKDSREKLN